MIRGVVIKWKLGVWGSGCTQTYNWSSWCSKQKGYSQGWILMDLIHVQRLWFKPRLLCWHQHHTGKMVEPSHCKIKYHMSTEADLLIPQSVYSHIRSYLSIPSVYSIKNLIHTWTNAQNTWILSFYRHTTPWCMGNLQMSASKSLTWFYTCMWTKTMKHGWIRGS